MKTMDDRVYVDGKLVAARRSNVGLETDEMFPGPGGGVPRASHLGMTARASQSAWPFDEDGQPINDKEKL